MLDRPPDCFSKSGGNEVARIPVENSHLLAFSGAVGTHCIYHLASTCEVGALEVNRFYTRNQVADGYGAGVELVRFNYFDFAGNLGLWDWVRRFKNCL